MALKSITSSVNRRSVPKTRSAANRRDQASRRSRRRTKAAPPRPKPRKWLFVANPASGSGRAIALAHATRILAEKKGIPVRVHETDADQKTRYNRILEEIASQNPTESDPVGVLGFGGDGLLGELFQAAIEFGSERSLQELMESLSSGAAAPLPAYRRSVILGSAQAGSMNDLSRLHWAGSSPESILRAIENGVTIPLPLGAANLRKLSGEETAVLFPHSLIGGAIGEAFNGRRYKGKINSLAIGLRAVRKGLWFGTGAHVFNPRPAVHVTGKFNPRPVSDLIFSPLNRIARLGGFPVAPIDGIGAAFLPHVKLPRLLAASAELAYRGILSHVDLLERIQAEGQLSNLDPGNQGKMLPGEWTGFEAEEPIGFEANGDGIGYFSSGTVYALPSWPLFLTHPNSPAAVRRAFNP